MNEKKYIQVTDSMNAPENRAQELAPPQAPVQDNCEKIVIAMDCGLISGVGGIKIVKTPDFLLSAGLQKINKHSRSLLMMFLCALSA